MMFRETSSRSRSAAVLQEKQLEYTIYCDLDGVLVDFEHGVRKVFPDIECSHDEEFPIQQLKSRNVLWDRIQSSNSFFEHLPWATGGKQLWNILHSHTKRTNRQLHILTGVPTYETSRIEKFRWCQRELNLPSLDHIDMAGPFRSHMPGLYHANAKWYGKKDTTTRDVVQPPNSYDVDTAAAWQNTYEEIVGRCDQPATNVITCWSERKHHESKPGAVLIDDRIDLKHAWEQKGGIFIHHQTGNIMNTIEQLMFHGIIQEEDWIDHLQHPKRGDVVDDELNLNNIPKQQPRRDDSLYIW